MLTGTAGQCPAYGARRRITLFFRQSSEKEYQTTITTISAYTQTSASVQQALWSQRRAEVDRLAISIIGTSWSGPHSATAISGSTIRLRIRGQTITSATTEPEISYFSLHRAFCSASNTSMAHWSGKMGSSGWHQGFKPASPITLISTRRWTKQMLIMKMAPRTFVFAMLLTAGMGSVSMSAQHRSPVAPREEALKTAVNDAYEKFKSDTNGKN